MRGITKTGKSKVIVMIIGHFTKSYLLIRTYLKYNY
jgi:hypothetical protein